MTEQKGTLPHTANEPAFPTGSLQADLARARQRRIVERTGEAVALGVVLFFAVVFIFPLYWMVITSLKTLGEVFQVPPVWWPARLMWSNYPTSLAMFPFWRYAWNTVQITVPVTIGV